MECTCGRDCFKCGRDHLSGISWLCGAVLEQHRVLVFGLKCQLYNISMRGQSTTQTSYH